MGESPIFYFDRCVGSDIPESLRRLGMKNVYHHHIHRSIVGEKPGPDGVSLFHHGTRDDVWMNYVGPRGWIVISQDYRFQLEDATLSAIKQHRVRVFYLWGAEAPKVESMRTFLNARKKILEISSINPGPYIFRVRKNGVLKRFM